MIHNAVFDLRAHPRSRGENDGNDVPWESDEGSSPLTRGKRVLDTEGTRDARLIPAHAGKTSRSMGVAARLEAHPRSRGENVWTTPAWYEL